MNIEIFLSFFTLLLIALAVNLFSIKLKQPYTVLLVIAGSLLVPLTSIEPLAFIASFKLTPELLFFVFLPILIFESAYNMRFHHVQKNKISMGILAVLGLLISTFFIGFVGQWVFESIGLKVPLLVILLFGAIISSTDPVAVLALFKEYGAPHRLTLIFEGESLFNDGTAFALFLVFLDVLTHGYSGYPTILTGIFAFTTMLIGGILFGLFVGFIFSKLIEWVKGQDFLEMTLTLLVAHFTFLLTELISEHLVIAGQPIRLSPIISTLTASMVIGNYGRFKMSLAVEEYMDKFWSYFAFISNSLVFILMGLLFASLSISLKVTLLPILLTILVVAIARAVSVYASIGLINKFHWEEPISWEWQHLLAWGSLRGALAVVMTLLIPDNLTLPNWHYDFSIKEFIIAITIGCIYFTLLIKATTIGTIVRKLKIDSLSVQEEISYYKSKALIYQDIINKLNELYVHHHLNAQQYQQLITTYQELHHQFSKKAQDNTSNYSHFVENMLRLYALTIEQSKLKEIFRRGEINEKVYKKILTMLDLQKERIINNEPQFISAEEHSFHWQPHYLKSLIRKLLFLSPKAIDAKREELYLYYRTQYKLASAILHEINSLENSHLTVLFNDKKAVDNVLETYHQLQGEIEIHIRREIKANQAFLDRLNQESAQYIFHTIENNTLDELYKDHIIDNKIYISLKKEFNN
jgi:CPA1 family monovalent cation:H+ antiporter